MFLHSFFFLVLASVYAATFSINDTVITTGLRNALYTNKLAVVVGDAHQDEQDQTRYPVIFWNGFDNPNGPFSVTKALKPENLIIFNADAPDFLPDAQFDPSNQAHLAKLDAYNQMFVTIWSDENSSIVKFKHSLFISSILKDLGHPAMFHIIADVARKLQ